MRETLQRRPTSGSILRWLGTVAELGGAVGAATARQARDAGHDPRSAGRGRRRGARGGQAGAAVEHGGHLSAGRRALLSERRSGASVLGGNLGEGRLREVETPRGRKRGEGGTNASRRSHYADPVMRVCSQAIQAGLSPWRRPQRPLERGRMLASWARSSPFPPPEERSRRHQGEKPRHWRHP